MFYRADEFEFTSRLEENWQTIRNELEALPESNFIPWKETILYSTGWDVFGLYAFGKKVEENCQLCPQATRVLETIPGLVTGGFSSLKPQTHILPHVGYNYKYSSDGTLERTQLNNEVLRCHLGLIIPPTFTQIGCAIRVGDELRNWEEGKCLVFDDTIEHEAWNRSQGTRVVMIVDFLKEEAQRT